MPARAGVLDPSGEARKGTLTLPPIFPAMSCREGRIPVRMDGLTICGPTFLRFRLRAAPGKLGTYIADIPFGAGEFSLK